MPLTKRLIEPTHVSRERIPAGVKNELEFVTNNTLANIILQLSSLSKHAEDIFGELYSEATGFTQRTVSLRKRLDRLASKVTQLDSSVEEVALQDINQRKQFRSSNSCDERVVSRESLPNALKDLYESCDSPPPLNKLNQFRTDGKDGLKFYTDPDHFFDVWKHDMLKDRQRPDRVKKPGRSRTPSENKGAKAVRQPQNHVEQMRARTVAQEAGYTSPAPPNVPGSAKSGYPFSLDQYGTSHNLPAAASYDTNRYGTMRSQSRPGRLDLPPPYDSLDAAALEDAVVMVDYRTPSQNLRSPGQSPQASMTEIATRSNTRGTPTRPSQPPPAPPSSGSGGNASTRSTPNSSRDNFPPPPPDVQGRRSPSPTLQQDFPPPPGMEPLLHMSGRSSKAPPPPPPPPLGMTVVSKSSTVERVIENVHHLQVAHSALRTPAPVQVTNTMVDPRSDLLAAIRKGIHLRKVEQQHEQQSTKMEEKISSLHNVAEIIARRKAMHHSESDTSSETEADSDWDENR